MGLAGRSPHELIFQLRQAAANLRILVRPPRLTECCSASPLALPDAKNVAARLKGSAFEANILLLARSLAAHRFPLFGSTVETGPEIEWRRDYINAKTSSLRYFKLIPYLDFTQVGDHKNVWELNRHQHLVVLAQAYLFTQDSCWLLEIAEQLKSWWSQNPFLQGINWASALEVAFRALSWVWVDHLLGAHLPPAVQQFLLEGLHKHATYLEHNLSTYFSPNTHLLGEGVALHAIGLRLNVNRWRVLGARTVDEQLDRQVHRDGSHFEQSTYYHLYALDLFLLHYVLAGRPEEYRVRLAAMADFLSVITGKSGRLSCFGDDDGGRLFHPYGPRELFGRATMATCAALFPGSAFKFDHDDAAAQSAWWLGITDHPVTWTQPQSRLFVDSGLASIADGDTHVLVDMGSFGPGGAGHSHADALSLTVRMGTREILIDPGTFTYVADAGLRNAFRGTGFHNTIRINGQDQADATQTFRWEQKPVVHLRGWETRGNLAFLDAECSYREFTHRRRVLSVGSEMIFVLDQVTGPAGEHLVEQFWHLQDEESPILFSDPAAAERQAGLRSRVYGEKEPALVLRAAWKTSLPHTCGAAISFGPADGTLLLSELRLSIPGVFSVTFAARGFPVVSRP